MRAEPTELEAVRRQIGEAIWEARLKEARDREVIVGRVERAVAAGCDFRTAVLRHGEGMGAATIRRWADRLRNEGLIGLVRRNHGPRIVELPPPTRQLILPIPKVSLADSRREAGPRRPGKRAHPLVKWSGGKAAIVELLAGLAPSGFRAYHEPFVGGGALFFRLRPGRAFLSDLNSELTNLYTVVRDQPEALIGALARHQNTREHYYAVRGIHPDSLRPIERAARTLFLNRTCFNGIYRVNSHGLFNVPYGKQEHTSFFQPEALRQAHVALGGARISCCDFARGTERARSGDFVYLDPPYVAGLRGGQGFTRYQSAGFGEDDERRVADLVRTLDRRGCFVMLSSADTEAIRALYRGFRIESVTVQRQVGGHAGRRGRAGEIVIRNYGDDAKRPRRPRREAGRTVTVDRWRLRRA